MPSSGITREWATRIGALDDAAATLAAQCDADTLRTIARNSNRIADRGDPLLVLPWNAFITAGVDDTPVGQYVDWASWPAWKLVIPSAMPTPHKANLRTAEGYILASVTNACGMWLQICTSAVPFNAHAPTSAPNVISLLGTGAEKSYTFEGLPLGSDPFESIEIWQRGEPTTSAMSGALGPSTGTIASCGPNWIRDSAATWSININSQASSLLIGFLNSDGAAIAGVRRVHGILSGRTDELFFEPPHLTPSEQTQITAGTYTIFTACQFKLFGLSIYESDGWAP